MRSPLINAQYVTRAATSRLLIAIAFHFVKDRLGYLDNVLQSLAVFPVQRRDIVVFTNTTNIAEQESIRKLFHKAGLVDGCDARLVVEGNLPNPRNLAWAHKKLISGPFLALSSSYSHFVSLEDDLPLTFENFVYFLVARDILRPFGLVPAFLRTEWSAERECRVNTDSFIPVMLAQRPFILDGDYAFVALDNPSYSAFILDQDLAKEYVNSRWFDLKRSDEVNPFGLFEGALLGLIFQKPPAPFQFGIIERAAMGLTFENPPAPFAYRAVVPVSITTRIAPQCAWLAHVANNYADNSNCHNARIAMTDLFVGEFDAQKEVKLSTFKSTGQELSLMQQPRLQKFLAMCYTSMRNVFRTLRTIRNSLSMHQ